MKNTHIIKKNEEFQEIISKKKSIKNNTFIIYLDKKNTNNLKYGISVGKKIGNAVCRNQIKRQVRMMFSEKLDIFTAKKIKIILIVRSIYLEKSYEENLNSLVNLFSIIK